MGWRNPFDGADALLIPRIDTLERSSLTHRLRPRGLSLRLTKRPSAFTFRKKTEISSFARQKKVLPANTTTSRAMAWIGQTGGRADEIA